MGKNHARTDTPPLAAAIPPGGRARTGSAVSSHLASTGLRLNASLRAAPGRHKGSHPNVQ